MLKIVLRIILIILVIQEIIVCNALAKVPSWQVLKVPVDFSKKGTVFETDFQAPWNIWGSDIGFFLIPIINNKKIRGYQQIENYIDSGYEHDGDGYLKPPENSLNFKIKITLTPLGWASENVTITLDNRQNKHYIKGQKIEEIVSVPLYGKTPIVVRRFDYKTLMIADLQRLRHYHIRVESLQDIEIPSFVSTVFYIESIDTKH